MIDSALRARVGSWLADDPDERDRTELRGLLDAADGGGAEAERDLRDRFAGRLEFGTAGLRGRLGAGPNRMNRAVVRATTAAVAGWLSDRATLGTAVPGSTASGGVPGAAAGGAAAGGGPHGDSDAPSVVVGCDARHRSREFADEAAAVLAGAGVRAHLLPRPCPTPLLAFAVRHLNARAGIMITASHNPAEDNGYKLYLGDGAQIIPPADAEISGRIERLGPLSEVPVADPGGPLVTRHGDDVAKAYLAAVAARLAEVAGHGPEGFGQPARTGRPPLTVVYTPLHGVAGALMLRAVERAGLAVPHVVKAQAEPDPDFPTVAFPNPEEPGALDLALKEAVRVGADLVLASDPDGDRLAVAVPDDPAVPGSDAAADIGGGEPGGWRQLTGDQLGALLGAYLLRPRALAPGDPGSPGLEGPGSSAVPFEDRRKPVVATTIVSATLLRKIAAAAGAGYAETLTGFKWIARAAGDRPGSELVFGYEEALGYMIGQTVRDKDGIGAALAVLAMAAEAKEAGRTLLADYDALERRHGVHLTRQLSLRIGDTAAVMRRIRAAPPATLGGLPVTEISDYAEPGTGLPPSDALRFTLGADDSGAARVVVRPSGTEPKIKAYLEVVQPVPGGDGLAVARAAARARLAPLRTAVAKLLGGPER